MQTHFDDNSLTDAIFYLKKKKPPRHTWNNVLTIFHFLQKAKKPLKQEYLADAPPPIIPKGQKITSLADLDPVEIASQMTLMEEKLFLAIRPKEFYHQAWNKPNKEVEEPNITKLTNNFNKMINWVTTEIVKVQEVKERAEVISKFIRVAKVHRNEYPHV